MQSKLLLIVLLRLIQEVTKMINTVITQEFWWGLGIILAEVVGFLLVLVGVNYR